MLRDSHCFSQSSLWLPRLASPTGSDHSHVRHVEYFNDHVRISHLLFDGVLEPKDGALRPSGRPGLGWELRRADAERYRVG